LWPIDLTEPKKYVFLARAFDQLGKAMFGDKWIDTKWPKHSPELELVRDKIVELCRNNKLALAVRPLDGGEMKDFPISWWNTEPEHWQRRFYTCQIDPDHPFRDAPRARASWIYVKCDNLDRYLRGEDRTPVELEKSNDALKPRVRDTLLKIIVCMAIKKYHHDPKAARTQAAIKIANDLAEMGFDGPTDDTIRKYLQEASELLPSNIASAS
jgi:hypothetical protein